MPQILDLKKREQSGYIAEKGKSKRLCGAVLLVVILDAKSQTHRGLQSSSYSAFNHIVCSLTDSHLTSFIVLLFQEEFLTREDTNTAVLQTLWAVNDYVYTFLNAIT